MIKCNENYYFVYFSQTLIFIDELGFEKLGVLKLNLIHNTKSVCPMSMRHIRIHFYSKQISKLNRQKQCFINLSNFYQKLPTMHERQHSTKLPKQKR